MMKFTVLLALVACASAAVIPKNLNPAARVVGGSLTNIEEVPYLVSLRQYNSHICGGSIITNRWIITAASCVSGGRRDSYSMRTGSSSSTSGGEIYFFGRLIAHNRYRKSSTGINLHDIALLRLSLRRTIPFDSTRQPIPLFRLGDVITPGTEALIAGWGATRDYGPPSVTTLRSGTVTILDNLVCSRSYAAWTPYVYGFPSDQICAGSDKGGRDFCAGDAGGPLVINGRLAAIASWGNGCGRADYPGVYNEVSFYENWMNVTMNLYNSLP